MSKKKIAVLVGSLRKDSFNKKTASFLIKNAPKSLELEVVEIGNLPLYNEDLETNVPKEFVEFREKIKAADGFLFLTPEYNRAMSGALKNSIDVASRPWGHNLWGGKPGAVVSVSISALGGFAANHNVRQTMVVLDSPLMQQPEAYIGNAHTLFNEQGELVNEGTQQYLKDFMVAFETWVNRF